MRVTLYEAQAVLAEERAIHALRLSPGHHIFADVAGGFCLTIPPWRQDLLPASAISQWWVSRPKSAVFGIAKQDRSLAEGQVGGDDDWDAFIEMADEVEELLASGRREGR